MSQPAAPSLRLGLGVLTAVVCGAVLWSGLAALATPADYPARRAALAERVAQLEQAAKLPAPAGGYGARAVCTALDEPQLAIVRQAIQAAAGPNGVRISYLATQPSGEGRDGVRIAPVALRLRAEGSYDALSGFIDRLALVRPVIFVDQLDLQAAAPDVVLKLTGKVFCWTSAQQ
jgi:hypothetical protein